MDHPDISVRNANLYFEKMVSEAENSRKLNKVSRTRRAGLFFRALWNQAPDPTSKSKQVVPVKPAA